MSEETPGTKLALRDTPTDLKEIDKKIMLTKFCEGMTLTEVAEQFGVSYSTIQRYSRAGNWNAEKAAYMEEMKELSIVSNQDVMATQAIDRTIRALYIHATNLEKSVAKGEDPTINYKHLVDALDKAVRLKMHVDSGGVAKSEVNVKKQTIDWNKMIELSVKAKKDQGEAFDEKGFLRKVIDAQVVDKPGSK